MEATGHFGGPNDMIDQASDAGCVLCMYICTVHIRTSGPKFVGAVLQSARLEPLFTVGPGVPWAFSRYKQETLVPQIEGTKPHVPFNQKRAFRVREGQAVPRFCLKGREE